MSMHPQLAATAKEFDRENGGVSLLVNGVFLYPTGGIMQRSGLCELPPEDELELRKRQRRFREEMFNRRRAKFERLNEGLEASERAAFNSPMGRAMSLPDDRRLSELEEAKRKMDEAQAELAAFDKQYPNMEVDKELTAVSASSAALDAWGQHRRRRESIVG